MGSIREFSPGDGGHPRKEMAFYSSTLPHFLVLSTAPEEMPSGSPGRACPSVTSQRAVQPLRRCPQTCAGCHALLLLSCNCSVFNEGPHLCHLDQQATVAGWPNCHHQPFPPCRGYHAPSKGFWEPPPRAPSSPLADTARPGSFGITDPLTWLSSALGSHHSHQRLVPAAE